MNTPGALAQVSTTNPGMPPCGKTKKAPPPPPYQLIRLEVTKACAPPAYWQVVGADQTVQVTAITSPNAPSAWSRLDWGTNVKQVSRAVPGPQTITCRMDSGPSQSVQIDVYDLTSLAPDRYGGSGPIVTVYEVSGVDLELVAATEPDSEAVWRLLSWSSALTAGSGAIGVTGGDTPNRKKIALSPPRDVKVRATLGCSPALGQKQLETTLHICAWPNLEVQQLEFQCYSVMNDGVQEIGKRFDKKWIKGRPDPATNCVTDLSQSPLCYRASSQITLTATFNVTTKPTEREDVWVSGIATVGASKLIWKQQIAVDPSDATVQMANVVSDNPLPSGVAVHDPLTINWYMTNADGSWKGIGSTKHLLYVTLADRATLELYWTLLDISCSAAAGKTTENEFVAASFVPFKNHRGDGNGFPRKGDALKLSYYKDGWKTQKSIAPYNDPWSTRGILGGADASGRCGGWANLLLHMWAIHGVKSARKRWYIRSLNKDLPDDKQRFLVKNVAFPSSRALTIPGSLYTYKGAASLKMNGAPGQGKTNPQFDFGDHVVLKHNGKLYDPSYGLGPYPDDQSYFAAALDGLGSWTSGKEVFTSSDGTPQHIPKQCAPYSQGFAEFRIVDTRITFDMIAAAFGLSKQAIFDHARNAALKSLRKTPDKVVTDDRIIVTRDLAHDGPWVFGHDI